MNTKNLSVSVISLAVVLALLVIGEKQAFAGKVAWTYQSSHGMNNCAFSARPAQGTMANAVVNQTGSRSVSISGDEGTRMVLRLVCARSQTWDPGTREYIVGPEVAYSGPGGSGASIGYDAPLDPGVAAPIGYSNVAKGREWTVDVGSATASYTLTGGSDALSVQVVPVAKPATKAELAPIAAKVDKVEKDTEGGFKNRTLSFQAWYRHDLNSIDQDFEDRRGIAVGLHFYLKPWETSVAKLTLGLDYDYMFREMPVVAAPNVPANGFNSYIDSKSWTLTPMLGFDVMPNDYFQFFLRGGLGLMVIENPTAPISQKDNGDLYSQQYESVPAFAYRANMGINVGIPVTKSTTLMLGPALGLSGNITKLPTGAGPEQTCNAKTLECVRRPDGHFIDLYGGIGLGGQLNLF